MKVNTQEVADAFSSAQVAYHYPRASCLWLACRPPFGVPGDIIAASMR